MITGERLRSPGMLRDWRQWMWWFYLASLLFGTVTFTRNAWTYQRYMPSAIFVAVVLGVVLTAVLLTIVHVVDRLEVTPASVVVACLAWGALAAPSMAVFANDAMTSVYGELGVGSWTPALTAPTDEETLKLVGVVAVLYLTRHRVLRPIDGLVYGALVGIGFEVIENGLYIVQRATTDPNSDVEAAITVGIGRIVLGFGGHAIFTGIAGFGIAYALTRPGISTARRVAAAVAGYAVAWLLHFLWNSPLLDLSGAAALLGPVVKYAILIAAFVVAAHVARREDRTWIVQALADQPSTVVGPGDVVLLTHHRARRAAYHEAGRRGHRRARRALKHVQEGQVVLAEMLRTGARAGDPGPVPPQQEAVAAMRARAVALGALPPVP